VTAPADPPEVPDALAWWAEHPDGAAWLERLPDLIAACAAQWDLRIGEPFDGRVSYVSRATTEAGTPVVLKLNFPEAETEHEADALGHWDGQAAVRLLARDRERHALLLERCTPGDLPAPEQADRVVADVLTRLHRTLPASDHPFRTLEHAAAEWAEHAVADWVRLAHPFPRRLLDEALGLMEELLADAPEDKVLCHQDLHHGNVLRRGDEWIAIDPKPLAAERAFDLVGALRHQPTRQRLDFFADALDLDRERVRGWALAHAIAWCFQGDGVLLGHVAAARALSACR